MNTTIILVRHGVTDWNYAGRVQGRSDISLAPEGERQAEAAAERLASEPWDALYSSPLQRAYQTAMTISRRIGKDQVLTDARLMERNMGEAEGLFDLDLQALWPGVPWDSIPGMEPVDQVAARAHAALKEMAIRHPGGRLVCVAHGSLIRTFLRSLSPAGDTPLVNTHPRPASVAVVGYDGERFTLESPPDHRHILQDGIEYTGEKGRLSVAELVPLLPDQPEALESVVWQATAIETAWADGRLAGFARAFTDGVRYGCIDIAVALPGYEQVRPALIHRLERRYPNVTFKILS